MFCRAERTLHADLQRGKRAELLKSEYLVGFGLTARQFNAVRIQLQGKRKPSELLPLEIENLKTKIKKAKKTLAKRAKRVPDSAMVHGFKHLGCWGPSSLGEKSSRVQEPIGIGHASGNRILVKSNRKL